MPEPEPPLQRTSSADPSTLKDVAPRPTFLQIVAAVFWSFFGVRKKRKLDEDAAAIKPIHVVVAGLIGGLVFVLTLILLVRMIVAGT
jgi:Protein of unknown function (DUF2970)